MQVKKIDFQVCSCGAMNSFSRYRPVPPPLICPFPPVQYNSTALAILSNIKNWESPIVGNFPKERGKVDRGRSGIIIFFGEITLSLFCLTLPSVPEMGKHALKHFLDQEAFCKIPIEANFNFF